MKCMRGEVHLRRSLHSCIRFSNQSRAIQNPKLVVINLDTEHKEGEACNCQELQQSV